MSFFKRGPPLITLNGKGGAFQGTTRKKYSYTFWSTSETKDGVLQNARDIYSRDGVEPWCTNQRAPKFRNGMIIYFCKKKKTSKGEQRLPDEVQA